ncbi:AMP-binding protein [Paraferrimonas sedimenticola]|uniref:AMP-dependent synthetase n=1 Tax=Paraferrimonas sedimenticola TaxID=375674 RepID=A0AA37VTK3_9GAMM|nr:AMP-binding protein [Paraferrimonas sedimenticola]GLP95379.1 AMP-dependent synthetase [Paraferrimonas sedimenticola]
MQTSVKTQLEMLDHWVEQQGDRVFLRQPINGQYVDYTWAKVKQQAQQLAGSLRHLGLQRGDKIAILSKNCAEWFITDLALMMGGYISVPIYPTANADTIRYVVQHSEAKAVFVGKLDFWKDQEAGVGGDILRLAMPYDTMPAQYSWETLLSKGEPLTDYPYPKLDELMTLIYTSGSTGNPKGVMHDYGAYCLTSRTIAEHLGGSIDDRVLSYLPLAHITERTYIQGAVFYYGGTVGFAESLDTFVDDVKRAAPTLFLSVPRLWTLFQKNIIEKIGESKLNLLLSLPIIKGLVAKKIRAELGLAHARVLGCGSAPVAPSLLEWYNRLGMKITEAWGMSENCAYATLNFPFRQDKIGTVGKAGLGCEVRIGDNDELQFKSPGNMLGYYKQEEATKEAFTEDGYLRTGDCASIDADGFVTITGRVKDNFKSAKGKYVAPVPIERKLAQNTDIELLCVMGAGLPHPIALIQLSDVASARNRDEVRNSLKATLDQVNQTLESHEILDAMVVVSEKWDVDNDVLTPTLKIKRHVLEQRFNSVVDGLRKGVVRWQDEL